jgi:hypothetical protein
MCREHGAKKLKRLAIANQPTRLLLEFFQALIEFDLLFQADRNR